jgi:hypothetical protein
MPSCNHCCRGKGVALHILSVLYVDFVIQHAMHMCRTVSLAVTYFSTYHKRHDYLVKGYRT